MWMPGDAKRDADNMRDCIRSTITRREGRGGPQLTDAAKTAAVEHAAQHVERGPGKGMNWGQLADLGVHHVTAGIYKK